MQGLLQPSQQTLLVRSPTEGSLKSYSRYESKGKKRILYKNNKGEIVDPPEKSLRIQNTQYSQQSKTNKSRTTTPTPSETIKTQTIVFYSYLLTIHQSLIYFLLMIPFGQN